MHSSEDIVVAGFIDSTFEFVLLNKVGETLRCENGLEGVFPRLAVFKVDESTLLGRHDELKWVPEDLLLFVLRDRRRLGLV